MYSGRSICFFTTQGADVATYANAIHANLQNGKPGVRRLSAEGPSRWPGSISASGARRKRSAADGQECRRAGDRSPAQGEVIGGTFASRREDSDQANDRFRLYEVAAAVISTNSPTLIPGPGGSGQSCGAAQGAVEWPFNAKCDPEIPLMDPSLIELRFNASFAHLDQWARKGTQRPARLDRIEGCGTPQASVVTDKMSHGLGGVRTLY
jgi:hypothetical protein